MLEGEYTMTVTKDGRRIISNHDGTIELDISRLGEMEVRNGYLSGMEIQLSPSEFADVDELLENAKKLRDIVIPDGRVVIDGIRITRDRDWWLSE